MKIAIAWILFSSICFSQESSVFNVPPSMLDAIPSRSNTVINLLQGNVPDLHVGSEDADIENFVVNLLDDSNVELLNVNSGASINVSGGSIGQLGTFEDSQVNLLSGSISRIVAKGGTLNISGGTIAGRFTGENTHITISGGDLPSRIILNHSVLNLVGRDFETRLRSVAGTLADGTSFEYTTRNWDDTSTINFVTVPEPATIIGFVYVLPLLMRRSRTRVVE